jgi:hypothetical protein
MLQSLLSAVVLLLVTFNKCDAFLYPAAILTSQSKLTETNMLANTDDCKGRIDIKYLSRRFFLSAATLTAIASSSPPVAMAGDGQETIPMERKIVSGKVTMKSIDGLPEGTSSSSALYITARPNKPDNVPRAILDGSNGKAPPVLASRIQSPQFPLDFQLSTLDLTQEGAAFMSNNRYWFEGQDLTISARWDTDGVASTRDPTDLVGRSQYIASKGNEAIVQLSGRGLTGKLVTGKSKN